MHLYDGGIRSGGVAAGQPGNVGGRCGGGDGGAGNEFERTEEEMTVEVFKIGTNFRDRLETIYGVKQIAANEHFFVMDKGENHSVPVSKDMCELRVTY